MLLICRIHFDLAESIVSPVWIHESGVAVRLWKRDHIRLGGWRIRWRHAAKYLRYSCVSGADSTEGRSLTRVEDWWSCLADVQSIEPWLNLGMQGKFAG